MAAPKDIDEALHMLQADLPVLTKDRSGQVGNQKTKYADLAQANEQVLTRLNALGVIWVCCPTLLQPDYRFVLDWELKHVPSGTRKHGLYPIKGDSPMQQGSAITYGRRYALLAVTGVIAEDEDDDAGTATANQRYAQRSNRQRAAEPADEGGSTMQRAQRRNAGPALPSEDPDGPVGPDQHRHMRALWNEQGMGGEEKREARLADVAEILALPELNSSADLTRAQANTVITALRERKAKAAGGEAQ